MYFYEVGSGESCAGAGGPGSCSWIEEDAERFGKFVGVEKFWFQRCGFFGSLVTTLGKLMSG